MVLVVCTLALFGYLSLRARRAELSRAHEETTQHLGSAMSTALQAALQDGLFDDVGKLLRRMRESDKSTRVAYVDLTQAQNNQGFLAEEAALAGQDMTRGERARRVEITQQPYGEHVTVQDKPMYAYAMPLYGRQHVLMGIFDVLRSDDELERAYGQAVRDTVLALGGMSLLLIVLLSLTVRQELTQPILRLVGAVNEVSKGDYTGAILRERSDEVGLLADRFNEMTRSLREARGQILAGMDAKLQLEQRLRHSDKLATIGQLAANIAHEVGTPLNVIEGRARVMAKRARSEDVAAVEKNAEIIANQAERITKIIQQLLDYARRKAPVRGPVDLRVVLRSTLEFLEHQMEGRQVTVTVLPYARVMGGETDGLSRSEPPKEPIVMGDADQLQQVCLNLCMNSLQAMADGGQITVAIEGLVRRRPGLASAAPSSYVMLAITDTGIGIKEKDLDRIFEPFYSTKNADSAQGERGSGLGLSVSAGIVKDHDGWIECDRSTDQPTRGTTFRVFLPPPDGMNPKTSVGPNT